MNTMVRRTFIAGIAGGASALLSRKAFAQTDIASAGNGGTAGAGANGGSVVVGGGSDVGCIGANGGIATADASGGDGNVAVIDGDDDLYPNMVRYPFTPCVPGTYVESGRGNLVAFCSAAGRWID